MFPPVEASVLENNPDFASLYKNLTSSVLNADGTTRADPASKARDAVREVSFPSSAPAALTPGCRHARLLC